MAVISIGDLTSEAVPKLAQSFKEVPGVESVAFNLELQVASEVDAAYQVAVGVQGGIAASLMRIAERASARGDSVTIRGAGALREIIQKEFRAEAERAIHSL